MSFEIRPLILAAALSLPALAVDLVRNGQPAATIVLPARPLPVESYAAAELQYHIEAATGVRLAIVAEDRPIPHRARLYLGRTHAAIAAKADPSTLPGNSYLIKTEGSRLFLAGKDSDGDPLGLDVHAGTLFAVYDILENHLGVRWLWPGKLGESIPVRRSLSLPLLNASVTPRLWFKEWRGGLPGGGWGRPGAVDDFSREQAKWLRRHRFGRSIRPDYRHAFGEYWDRFSVSHPEYFSMAPDGTRGPDSLQSKRSPIGPWVHTCVSEPGLTRQVMEDWKAKGMPEFLNVCENDGYPSCTCPRCLSWDAPEPEAAVPFEHRLAAAKKSFADKDRLWMLQLGSLSDRYARFWRTVSDEARRFRPDVKVTAYAYSNYKNPPVTPMALNENVLVGFVPKTPFPYDKLASERIQKEWSGWSQTGAMLFLRPNYTLHFHNFPVFYARHMGEDLKYAMAHAMKGADFDSLTGQYSTQGPTLYMLAKILNYPDMSVDAVLGEFYGAFGAARSSIQEYFAHWETVTQKFSTEGRMEITTVKRKYGSSLLVGVLEGPELCTPAAMNLGRAILAKARKQAAGDPSAAARVEWLALGLDHVELVLAAEKAHERAVDTGDRTHFRNAYKVLRDFRANNANRYLSNFRWLTRQEQGVWKELP
ncbi:MAG: DUF4838 domain-containing protein [Acidobacteria bacterium]|nr:DUF4838 domain-containing protein [Acidobacteriota bacterium]